MNENRSTHSVQSRVGGPRERDRCLREARRYLSPADAEDAVQEALLRAWRKDDAWIPADGPLPWLLTITRNEALRLLARPLPEPVADPPERPVNDPELDRVPLRLDVRAAIAGLSEDERRLLQMRYGDDLTQSAVATRLGIPEGTVKIRLHRLRLRLRAVLADEAARREQRPAGSRV
jgi:RNA polymerase sigma-70 factor (ECF subfamily)